MSSIRGLSHSGGPGFALLPPLLPRDTKVGYLVIVEVDDIMDLVDHQLEGWEQILLFRRGRFDAMDGAGDERLGLIMYDTLDRTEQKLTK